MPDLKIVLVHGASGSGKSYATERILAIDYQVTTERMDRLYAAALAAAGVEKPAGGYGIARWARSFHRGSADPDTAERFYAALSGLVEERVREAKAWRSALVIEGYALGFAKETALVRDAARAVVGEDFEIARVHLVPAPDEWRRNRAARLRRKGKEIGARALGKSCERTAPEPVAGASDYEAADAEGVRALADGALALQPFRWYQRFSLGPVSGQGRIDSAEKLGLVADSDLTGKRVIDICCNTGIHAFMAKQRGASEVTGIELKPRTYAKALELRKVLRRHSDLDARVRFINGDALAVLPTLGKFDTLLFFGALHYFPDYGEILGRIGQATDVAYVEFTFTEADNDTASAPGAIRAWTRKTGKTIYMGDRDATAEAVTAALPGFEIEARSPITRRNSDREIWRLRKTGTA